MPNTPTPKDMTAFKTDQGAAIYRMPIQAFTNFWVYAYVVLVDDYRVLIDTGSGWGVSNEHLEAGLKAVSEQSGQPVGLDNLTHILITHGHIDHFGGLAYVQPRTNAKIGIHELDRRTVTSYEERLAYVTHKIEQFFVKAGVPDEQRNKMLNTYQVNKHLFHSVPVDFTYEDIGMKLGPFEMLHVPGHCPGHVVIRLHNVLFSGDHVLDRISPHMAPESLSLNTGLWHYLTALRAVKAWANGVTLTLGGHENRVADLPARADAIIAHHEERLEKVRGILAVPRTIREVSAELFGSLEGYNAILAVEEAGAHVEYLYQYGDLALDNLTDFENSSCPVPLYYVRI